MNGKPNWKLILNNVGRKKITRKIDITAENLPKAEQRALRECNKHLMSRDVELVDNGTLTYLIFAGFRAVGTVEIVSI